MVLIIKCKPSDDIATLLQSLVSELQPFLTTTSRCELTLSSGHIQERLQGIHMSYMEAEKENIERRMRQQNKDALMHASSDGSRENVLLDRNGILDFMKLGSSKEAPQFILEFTARLDGVNWDSLYAYYLIHDLTLEMIAAAKQHFQTSLSAGDLLPQLQQQIKHIQNRNDCQHYLLTLLQQLWEWRQAGADKYSELIHAAKLYIRQNYKDDQLSLFDISKQIAVSSSHLSKIFSQETGQTMTDYLTLIRINKAKELLRLTRYKTFEIAFQVGYKDPHYFSNLFKKVTGLTPTEYRKHSFEETEEQTPERKVGR